ncbi:hypothetical protein [Streptomyces sp. NPDC048516]|uniref:hypothetical protein n=1 Tax=Streptomyces sp. NPDC048516 TaxID=3365565 RepID=UPI0037229ADD
MLHTPEAKVTTVKCNKKSEGVLWGWDAKFGMIDGVSNQTGMRTILVTKKKGSRAVFALGQNNPAGSHGLHWSHPN